MSDPNSIDIDVSRLTDDALADARKRLEIMLTTGRPFNRTKMETLGQPDTTKQLYCDICAEQERRELAALLDDLRSPEAAQGEPRLSGEKRCAECERLLPVICFPACSRNLDGLYTYCRECVRSRNQAARPRKGRLGIARAKLMTSPAIPLTSRKELER